MGLPIERWVRQAMRSRDPLARTADSRIMQDINELMRYQRQFWHERNNQLARDGELVALQGGFAGLPNVPPNGPLASITSISGTVALFTSSLHAPINANAVQSPQAYRFAVSGLYTTSTSPGNFAFDPRVGAGSTINTAISGTTMGAGANTALTASITNGGWRVEGDLTIRQVGAPGANSTVICFGNSYLTNAAYPASFANNIGIGGTQATVDLSVAAGFSLGWVATVTTHTLNTHQVHWSSWN